MSDYEKMRSYVKGYKDGENGKYDTGWDPAVHLFSLGFLGGSTVDVEAYDAGYEHGKRSVSSGK